MLSFASLAFLKYFFCDAFPHINPSPVPQLRATCRKDWQNVTILSSRVLYFCTGSIFWWALLSQESWIG